jgi:hypothetical protein
MQSGTDGKRDQELASCVHPSCGIAARAARADEHPREKVNGDYD